MTLARLLLKLSLNRGNMKVEAGLRSLLQLVIREQLKSFQAAKSEEDTTLWNKSVADQTGWCHFLQSAEWAKVKATSSWKSRRLELKFGKRFYPIVLYSRGIPGLGRVHYIPKLARLRPSDVAAMTLKIQRSIRGGVGIRLEIDQPYSARLHNALLAAEWLPAPAVQYDHTVVIDLQKTPEELFGSFKKRARWEISAASRRGVVIEKADINTEKLRFMFDMLRVTSRRANFRTRSRRFSYRYWRLFAKQGRGHLYVARHELDILAAAYVINIGDRAYYKDGGSVRHKTNLFASRLMQWQIMQDMQAQGCTSYDLCGVPGDSVQQKGIYLFKTGFGDPIRLQGSYILPLYTRRYGVWSRMEPTLLKIYLKVYRQLWY